MFIEASFTKVARNMDFNSYKRITMSSVFHSPGTVPWSKYSRTGYGTRISLGFLKVPTNQLLEKCNLFQGLLKTVTVLILLTKVTYRFYVKGAKAVIIWVV